MPLLGLALALLIGVSLGLLGGGGSTLTVPIFVYILGLAVKPAVAMSLGVVGTTSLVGGLAHWRAGNVNLRAVALFAPFAMAGTFAGARLAHQMSDGAQLALFATVMLAAAGRMLWSRTPEPAAGFKPAATVWKIAPLGALVGILTGLVGVGGGFLIVPALVLLAGLPMKQAIGSSLLVIALTALTGFAGYLGRVTMDWPLIAGFTALAVAGVLLGMRLTRLVSGESLKRGFAIFLLAMGTFVLWRGTP